MPSIILQQDKYILRCTCLQDKWTFLAFLPLHCMHNHHYSSNIAEKPPAVVVRQQQPGRVQAAGPACGGSTPKIPPASKCKHICHVCIINIQVPHEVENSYALAKRTSQIMFCEMSCEISELEVALGAPDRVKKGEERF